MYCMKCGKETEENEIFCVECLELMKKYPVKPGIVVHIPKQPAKKQVHHRRVTITPEEHVRKLSRQAHILTLLVTLAVGFALFFGLMAFDILEKSNMRQLLGQNYSVVVTTEPTAVTENIIPDVSQ